MNLTRKMTAAAALALIGLVVVIDVANGATLNPYRAPALFALGSGQTASGGHCAALPGK